MKSLNEKLQERRDELAKAERIYEPKYGGKDHSGYDTLMKYEVNYEREECFAKGFDAALTALAEVSSAEFEKLRAENAILREALKEYCCLHCRDQVANTCYRYISCKALTAADKVRSE